MSINFDYLFDDKENDISEILRELKNGTAQLVDIREQREWEQARFKCATHIALSDLVKGLGVDVLKKIKESNKKIYLHCRSGNRVRVAQQVLANFGCTEFTIIPASMLEMLEKGFQLTNGQNN